VSLCEKENDKSVFGVISLKTEFAPSGGVDPSPTQLAKVVEQGDVRAEINALGEGSIYVCDINGPLESGDLITTSVIKGYGAKQSDDIMRNYTVAKCTMDCDFTCPSIPKQVVRQDSYGNNVLDPVTGWPIWDTITVEVTTNEITETVPVMVPSYELRYILADSTQITKEEYDTHKANGDVQVYRAAFVGCTYHCG
jgi:hypothetical protein